MTSVAMCGPHTHSGSHLLLSALQACPLAAIIYCTQLADLSTNVQAIPGALAGIRDAADHTPVAAATLLLSALEQGLPSGGALYDEDALTGRCLAALGMLRPREPAVRLHFKSLHAA